ncbi:hypothetical protein [Vibrio alginolyticus]|uniref:hypothetical protein n=1 Tax=Vibrio alginolyticus TaxID=663 RepID=UPI00215B9078|nr:hypothetical protein [Vibrio alginolyticus]MCR9395670.1 hypothetical protein [Vibrio alginolyticus]
MLRSEMREDFIPLKSEMFQMCLSLYAYKTKYEAFPNRFPKATRHFLLEEATALRALSNEIILHLCKLDEDKSKVSFHAAKKVLSKSKLSATEQSSLNSKLKAFRSSINTLKTVHRNRYIAHLTEDGYPNLFDLPSFEEGYQQVAQTAYETFAFIWGDDVTFRFKVGSQEAIIIFNTELGLSEVVEEHT